MTVLNTIVATLAASVVMAFMVIAAVPTALCAVAGGLCFAPILAR